MSTKEKQNETNVAPVVGKEPGAEIEATEKAVQSEIESGQPTDPSAEEETAAQAADDETDIPDERATNDHPTRVSLREELVEQIRQSDRLPRGLRERLVAMAGTGEEGDREVDGEPIVRLSEAVAMFEETIPSLFGLEREDLHRETHPGGSTFFSGDPRSLSDHDANRIAEEQLANTGFARRERN